MPDFLTGFLYMLMIVFILLAAYLTSRWFAMRQNDIMQGKYIKIVDRVMLSKDKSIVIIQVGEKVFLMSENAQGFSELTALAQTDLIPIKSQGAQNMSFQAVLNKYLGLQLPTQSEPIDKTLTTLSDLKNRAANQLNQMMHKHKGKEHSDDEQK
ncbi:MAG: flagellar biosynthetic protein FliO [Hyphomonadaceae bacterium]|nr:flagellar biosynthetic protein FliO [Clostridia bacterium]